MQHLRLHRILLKAEPVHEVELAEKGETQSYIPGDSNTRFPNNTQSNTDSSFQAEYPATAGAVKHL